MLELRDVGFITDDSARAFAALIFFRRVVIRGATNVSGGKPGDVKRTRLLPVDPKSANRRN